MKRRFKILDDILKRTREDLEERKKRVPPNVILSTFDSLSVNSAKNPVRSFGKSLRMTNNRVAVIAEIKFASPTEGNLGSATQLLSRAKQYEKAGADAISIVTEKHYFKGDPLFVSQIKQKVSLPILQKDFIIHSYQIYEVANGGADAILLIAKLLTKEELVSFVKLSKQLGLEPVVEVNDELDLKKALVTNTDIIAVNARALYSFIVDIDRACKLIAKIPQRFVRLAFSGVSSRTEVKKYKMAGANGVLIGTSLMKAKNISDFLKSIKTT